MSEAEYAYNEEDPPEPANSAEIVESFIKDLRKQGFTLEDLMRVRKELAPYAHSPVEAPADPFGGVILFKTEVVKRNNWQGFVSCNGEKVFTWSTWGHPKKQTSQLTEILPKNVGRSNETSLIVQAICEIESKYRLKCKESNRERVKPMLAKVYEGKSKFPQFMQPKWDGVRCLTEDKVAWGRSGDLIPISSTLFDLPSGFILDGELLVLDAPVGDTISAISDVEKHHLLTYVIYDVVLDLPFKERYLKLFDIVKEAPNVKLSSTVYVETEEELEKYHELWKSQGFEGSIIRDPEATYTPGSRRCMSKYKNFLDSEFVVKAVEEGVGKSKGCAVFVFEGDKPFRAVPKGTVEQRKAIFDNAQDYVGQEWTVRYQYITDDGVPFHPVAIAPRVNYDK